MRGIRFIDPATLENYHTGDDWDLVMPKKIIGTPPVKLKYVGLEDRDGDLDFTTALRGVPSYGTRAIELTFEYCGRLENWTRLFTTIRNFLHGRRLQIVEPDDDMYYYLGRIEVGDPSGSVVKTFDVKITADTWKYRNTGVTVKSGSVVAGTSLNLANDWRPVVPDITTTAAVSFSFGGVTYSLSGSGSFKIPQIVLTHGSNVLTFISGSGTITFSYQEGAI